MPHVFVVFALITTIWSADGQSIVNGQTFKTLRECRAAKESFFQSEMIVRGQMVPTLAEEFQAICVVMTNVVPDKKAV